MSKFKEFDPKESENKSNAKLPLKKELKNEVEENKSSEKSDIFTPLAFTMSKTLNKKYGNRTIYHADDIANVEVIPTGSYTLNDASGIGGIAQGYIHEIFGPSGAGKTAAVLGVIASAQKMNLRCFYVDAENRFDVKRAKQFGVDVSKLLMSHNNIMEQIFDIIIDVLRSGEVQLVVLDSLATLMSEKEYEEDMEKVDMGAKAKLIGKGIKKIVGTISEIKSDPSKKVPTVIMTNQIRMSPGCFHGKTRVILEDGSKMCIADIVKNKYQGKVLSYNTETRQIEPKTITNWFNNGVADEFIQFITDNPTGNGQSSFACTANHHILKLENNKEIWVDAGSLNVGDNLIQRYNDYELSPLQEEFIIGGLLGDGCIRQIGQKYQYREAHGVEQNFYQEWKCKFFNKQTSNIMNKGNLYCESFISMSFKDLYDGFYKDGKKKKFIPDNLKLSPLAVAIWYMDDGTRDRNAMRFCTNSFHKDDIEKLVLKLKQVGINAHSTAKVQNKEYEIRVNVADCPALVEYIKDWILPEFTYKIPESLQNILTYKNIYNNIETEKKVIKIRYATIQKKYIKPKNHRGILYKYDIEVEGNHSYLVDNIVVHNSFGNPEFTPGGQAPKFFCSQRIRLQPKHYFDENFKEVSLSANETDNALVGVRVAHKHVKNTFAPPHRSGSYSLYWDGRCILQLEEMISLALVNGVIEQISAVSYQFEDQRFVGKQNMLTYFKESKSAAKKLSDKIIALTDKKDIETSNDPILSDYESP